MIDATMQDPAYRAESEKAKLEVDPMTGEEVEKLGMRREIAEFAKVIDAGGDAAIIVV